MKAYNTAVVIIPPSELWIPIQKIREKNDRAFNRWMPHITLLYPFREESQFKSLESEFRMSCNTIPAFNISIKDFNYFDHGKNNFTIWLKPEPTNLIVKLQRSLLSLVPDCNDVNKFKNGFTPHLSVGQIRGKNNLTLLLDELQKNWEEISFENDSISFISRKLEKYSKFEVKKQIQLKKNLR
jgi:2'-5' RNA ligase